MGVGVCVSVCLSVLGMGACECGGGCGRCIDMGGCAHVREMAGYVCSNDAVLFVLASLCQTYRECVRLSAGSGLKVHVLTKAKATANTFGLGSTQRFGEPWLCR